MDLKTWIAEDPVARQKMVDESVRAEAARRDAAAVEARNAAVKAGAAAEGRRVLAILDMDAVRLSPATRSAILGGSDIDTFALALMTERGRVGIDALYDDGPAV